MTPHEVFFFNSGAAEERDRSGLVTNRANVLVGFPLGGILSLAIMTCTRDRRASGHRPRPPLPGGAAGGGHQAPGGHGQRAGPTPPRSGAGEAQKMEGTGGLQVPRRNPLPRERPPA